MNIKQLRTTYQLKISLEDSKPAVWRRLLVNNDIKLDMLHLAIQLSMGWTGTHMHQFMTKNREFYGVKDDDFALDLKDETQYRISHILKAENDSFIYEYDFGDSWLHKVTLEKLLPFDPGKKLPYCMTGKRACPPEDCGGIWGYADLLEILKNSRHEEYEEMLVWLGGEFDPAYVDRKQINRLLLEYCQ